MGQEKNTNGDSLNDAPMDAWFSDMQSPACRRELPAWGGHRFHAPLSDRELLRRPRCAGPD
jgi:hypothetical protein